MKLRLLSRTWPNISKLERTVLILRPSMFIVAVVKRVVPASLNAWKHKTASVQKAADGCKWQKQKNLGQIKQTKKNQRVLAGTPPSKETRNIVFFCFSKVFPKCGVLQGNWFESQAAAAIHASVKNLGTFLFPGSNMDSLHNVCIFFFSISEDVFILYIVFFPIPEAFYEAEIIGSIFYVSHHDYTCIIKYI